MFQDLFMASKGAPVEYKGRLIQMSDHLCLSDGCIIRVKIESTNSDWRQGIRLDVDRGFEVEGQVIKKAILLWHDTAPEEVIIKVRTKNGQCRVRNIWDTGNGAVQSWYNAAAIIVETTPYGKRYHCNDGKPDDDFDDIIFSIEIMTA